MDLCRVRYAHGLNVRQVPGPYRGGEVYPPLSLAISRMISIGYEEAFAASDSFDWSYCQILGSKGVTGAFECSSVIDEWAVL